MSVLKREEQVCNALKEWLTTKDIGYKYDVGFLEFPRPSLSPTIFQQLTKDAEKEFQELSYNNYTIFETTIVVNFPEHYKKWKRSTIADSDETIATANVDEVRRHYGKP